MSRFKILDIYYNGSSIFILHTWGRSFLLRRSLCSTVSGIECRETVLWANTQWWPSAAVKTSSAGSLRSTSISPGSCHSHQSTLCCISSLRTTLAATLNHLQDGKHYSKQKTRTLTQTPEYFYLFTKNVQIIKQDKLWTIINSQRWQHTVCLAQKLILYRIVTCF